MDKIKEFILTINSKYTFEFLEGCQKDDVLCRIIHTEIKKKILILLMKFALIISRVLFELS
jgi:hypothetical protein